MPIVLGTVHMDLVLDKHTSYSCLHKEETFVRHTRTSPLNDGAAGIGHAITKGFESEIRLQPSLASSHAIF